MLGGVGAMGDGSTTWSLVGRDALLETAADFVRARHPGTALVFEGPAGIGKTSMWLAALDEAAGVGMRVISARAGQAEAQLSYACLGDLVEPLLDEFEDVLPEPQRMALGAVLLRRPAEQELDPRGVGFATKTIVAEAARRTPLAIALDDVQWIDPASRGVLEYAMRRLADAAQIVIATERTEAESSSWALEPVLGIDRVRRVALEALDEPSIHELVRREAGSPWPRRAVRELYRASGGNPLYALEIVRQTGSEGPPPEGGLRLPGRLLDVMGRRLDRLPRATAAMLEPLALMASPQLADLARLGDPVALDPAFNAGVLVKDEQGISFSHPLLAAATAERIPPARLAELHARLAAIAGSHEERARHLALATDEPSEVVSRELEAAAAEAASRGAPEAAAELLERALLLLPAGHCDALSRLELEASRRQREAGNLARAVELARSTVARLEGPDKAAGLLALAETEILPLDEAVEHAAAAVRLLGGRPRERVHARLVLANTLINASRLQEAREVADAAVGDAEPLDDRELRIAALTMAGELQVLRGDERGSDLLREGVELEGADVVPDAYLSPVARLGCAHLWADRLDEARPLLERRRLSALEAGDDFNRMALAMNLAELEWRAGELRPARRHAVEARLLGEQLGGERNLGATAYPFTLLEATAGDPQAARESGTRALAVLAAVGDTLFTAKIHWALGLAELGAGDASAAAAHLRGLPDAVEQLGVVEPGFIPCQGDVIEAAIGAGELERAERELARLVAVSAGMERPWATIVQARGRGQLAAARGDLAGALAHLERASAASSGLQSPFERARTLLWLGMVRRRAKRRAAARESLEGAAGAFASAGFAPWEALARAELQRIGGRAATPGELTEAERRVAALVAEGRSNREVAEMLFVTVRTVEANLTRAYAKLGVRSRTELASRWGEQNP